MARTLRDLSILVVDDNGDNLFILTDTLQEDLLVGSVTGVTSGAELFALVDAERTSPPQMILLDLQMPYEDGYVVLSRIREHPRLAGVVVVAVTANVLPHDLQRCREAGFDGFIGKPVDLARFQHQIERMLAGDAVWEPR